MISQNITMERDACPNYNSTNTTTKIEFKARGKP
jgi:hypothetical protein